MWEEHYLTLSNLSLIKGAPDPDLPLNVPASHPKNGKFPGMQMHTCPLQRDLCVNASSYLAGSLSKKPKTGWEWY